MPVVLIHPHQFTDSPRPVCPLLHIHNHGGAVVEGQSSVLFLQIGIMMQANAGDADEEVDGCGSHSCPSQMEGQGIISVLVEGKQANEFIPCCRGAGKGCFECFFHQTHLIFKCLHQARHVVLICKKGGQRDGFRLPVVPQVEYVVAKLYQVSELEQGLLLCLPQRMGQNAPE